jgi:hypothetical protein
VGFVSCMFIHLKPTRTFCRIVLAFLSTKLKETRPPKILPSEIIATWALRRGILVIASAYRTEDPGFESRQGVRV